MATGWCDYTGWDCQADNNGEVFTSPEEFIRMIPEKVRTILGYVINNDGTISQT